MAECIAHQIFDTDAFGVPFYRITELDLSRLAEELPALVTRPPIIIDAKVPASDAVSASWLFGRGFRKICTQPELVWVPRQDGSCAPSDLVQLTDTASRSLAAVTLLDELALSDEELRAHACNFTSDRFSQDPRLPQHGTRKLYEGWIRNSISGRCHVLRVGRSFFTFRATNGVVHADLLSVLDKGKGLGSYLVASLIAHARAIDATAIRVTTECENRASWRLFARAGFQLRSFQSVFHFVSTEEA